MKMWVLSDRFISNRIEKHSMKKILIITLITLQLLHECNGHFYSQNDSKLGEKNCFCELKGSIDDCSCSIDTVDFFNNNRIFPRLKSLLVRDYFRFFKVNLHKECPFWADDSKCAMRACSVRTCEEKDVPEGLKGSYNQERAAFKYLAESQKVTDCFHDLNEELGFLNTSLTQEAKHGFEVWADFDEQQDNFCISDDHQNGAEYVDLLLNPERYTGYRGPSAHRIWSSIYLENCFDRQNQPNALLSHIQMAPNPLSNLCIERRSFYRMLSGLHSSINIHLCSNYLLSEMNNFVSSNGEWGRNTDEFLHRFSEETTHGEGQNWLKNLYFVYLIELRALARAAPLLRHEPYFTGNDEEDESVRAAVNDILTLIESFPSHFNESLMFNGTSSAQLKTEFKEKFRNISRIMDCVGCEKCRLWGKLQIQGLGTALKILFSEKFDFSGITNPLKQLKGPLRPVKLKRSEIVSLFNAFARLSNSINELEEFRKVMR